MDKDYIQKALNHPKVNSLVQYSESWHFVTGSEEYRIEPLGDNRGWKLQVASGKAVVYFHSFLVDSDILYFTDKQDELVAIVHLSS
jgi:hypothetical protein